MTAIQLVSAFSSVINGGYLYTPRVAKAFVSSQNETIYEFEPQLKRQVISNETSEKMRYALECVVAKGSGRKAFVDGYRIDRNYFTDKEEDIIKKAADIAKKDKHCLSEEEKSFLDKTIDYHTRPKREA